MGLLFLPVRCYLRHASQSGICCRLFSISSSVSQHPVKGNKKWTKARLQPLLEWTQETESIYGPIIKTKQKAGKPTEKSEEKPVKPRVKKSVKVSSQESSPADVEVVKVQEISKQSSYFVEDKVKGIIEPPKVALNSVVFADTMDYEEVSESDVSHSQPMITKSMQQQKTTTGLEHSKVSVAGQVQLDTKNGSEKLSNLGDMSSTPAEREEVISYAGLKDSEEIVSAPADETGTRNFLSTILAFPPFTITWNATDGQRSIADVAKNSADLEPALRNAGFPSVSAILKATMPPENKFFLDRWEKEMIEELGEEGFQQYKQELFANGTNLHLCIQKFLEGQAEIDLKEPNRGYWISLETVFRDIADVACTEKPVKHPVLRYKGILDCVANYRGKTCIIDWKTSKKPKPDIRQTFDNPIQLAAYLGAYNSQSTLQKEVDSCLLVIGYQDGSPANVHQMSRMDCLRYWQTWQRRLHLHWSQHLGRSLSVNRKQLM